MFDQVPDWAPDPTGYVYSPHRTALDLVHCILFNLLPWWAAGPFGVRAYRWALLP